MRSLSFNRRARSRVRLTVFMLCVLAAVVAAVLSPIRRLDISVAAAGAPVLLTQQGSTRAIALDSVMRLAEPFQSQNPVSFASDNRTRITLFATNLTLATGENASAVSAEAEDFSHARYPLAVEYVGAVSGQTWMTAVVVRLNDNLGGDFTNLGDVLVGVTYHGATSNRVRIGLGHIGGGPPDDPPASPTPTPSPGATPDLGPGASFHGKQLFPPDNPWNQDISGLPVDPNSANLIAGIGVNTGLHPDFGTVYNGAPNGIPYVVVSGTQPRVPMNYTAYGDESDPGPYPVPPSAPIEGGPGSNGDRHVLVIDRDNWKLYELGRAFPVNNGASWDANCGAIFDLNSNALRPAGWTSADAAGLPIFPGLVRYDEVFEQGVIAHAIRFTVHDSRRAYIAPARHWASDLTSANLPPMGMRVRLKASFNISGFSAPMQVILRAMKTYGMIVADNGSNWYFSGAPDPRWDDDELSTLKSIKGSNFEVVQMGTIVTP
ncbi:MAG TPA: hypothetical protein VGO68_16685 [Pyrinomonadaceae bacterium]|jgi:hypothetical protein|nr:hypothetical protein [Pyrinomonadaceae bacterium]